MPGRSTVPYSSNIPLSYSSAREGVCTHLHLLVQLHILLRALEDCINRVSSYHASRYLTRTVSVLYSFQLLLPAQCIDVRDSNVGSKLHS